MLKKLYLRNFRNYDGRRFDFLASRVQFCGANGIGKTNILEAIHYLSILRSFKNASSRELVQNGYESFVLMAQVETDDVSRINIEQLRSGERKCFVNDIEEKRASRLLHNFRSVVFAPEDRLIISGTAAVRRRFFDILISLENNSWKFAVSSFAPVEIKISSSAIFIPLERKSLSAILLLKKSYPCSGP